MNNITLKIRGMHCDGCANRIKTLVEKEAGVRRAEVSFSSGEANIQYNAHAIDEDRISEIIVQAGFSVVTEERATDPGPILGLTSIQEKYGYDTNG